MRAVWPVRGTWKELLAIFFAGAAWDATLSLDTIYTARLNSLGVAITTLALTVLPYLMYDRIVEQAKVNWRKVLVLALGCALGAVLATEALRVLLGAQP